MTPSNLTTTVIVPALSLLPMMPAAGAEQMLMAVAWQESALRHRQQVGGPARGYWQFEPVGVTGVQQHHASKSCAGALSEMLDIPLADTYEAIQYNDVLAAAYARLLLWRHPAPLPAGPDDIGLAWQQYIHLWRPGRPRPETWARHYKSSWEDVV